MGFANYVKSRLLSVNPKFRKDPYYVFMLLLVKEMVDIQRSQRTVLRKATKVPNLNKEILNETSLEFLMRNNNAFTTFKTLRGSAMYYQDIKKKLMATIRQNGAPTLFCTFSSAEFDWDEATQKIYETVHRKKVSLDFIKSQSSAWKNRLISENVVQSTVHFSKRTDKIISMLTKLKVFQHDGVTYEVSSYFYRVEFQARGAPHLHCMFWLRGKNGELPPSIYSEENTDFSNVIQNIAAFGSSLINTSSNDVNCKDHKEFNNDCDECKNMKDEVERYQTHDHRYSCLKRKKMMRIKENEGHGRFDGVKSGEELLIQCCRYNFPKNPLDKEEVIMPFPNDYDKEKLKKAKEDYDKIRKYLLRLTNRDNFKNEDEWKNYCSFRFYDFLYEVGMFEKGENYNDEKLQLKARERYLTALRCEAKSNGTLVYKRQTRDVFTNNFNKKIFSFHPAHMDIQFVTDEYACAEYVTDYCTKLESGSSPLLREINEQAIQSGESLQETNRKLAKELDKGREVSQQEATYRVLGLPMTKFSEKVKFINTNHPNHREGLIKANTDELEEGESIFHNSLHDYYQSRPKNTDDCNWDGMTIAEFAANFEIFGTRPSSKNCIKLQNKMGYLIKRRKECVIRKVIQKCLKVYK